MAITGERKAELRRSAYSEAAEAIASVSFDNLELSDEEDGYVRGVLDELAEHMRRMSR